MFKKKRILHVSSDILVFCPMALVCEQKQHALPQQCPEELPTGGIISKQFTLCFANKTPCQDTEVLSISGRVLPPFRIIEKLTESILTCESLCKQQQFHCANKMERYCYLPRKDIEIQHIQMHLTCRAVLSYYFNSSLPSLLLLFFSPLSLSSFSSIVFFPSSFHCFI